MKKKYKYWIKIYNLSDKCTIYLTLILEFYKRETFYIYFFDENKVIKSTNYILNHVQ